MNTYQLMNTYQTLKNYKKQLREMFFVSINSNCDNWIKSNTYSDIFFGPLIKNQIEDKFTVDDETTYFKIQNGTLYLTTTTTNDTDIIISKYKFLFIPIDLKIYIYINKLKKNINEKDKYDKGWIFDFFQKIRNETTIIKLKNSLENLQSQYPQEMRKQKLKKLNNV